MVFIISDKANSLPALSHGATICYPVPAPNYAHFPLPSLVLVLVLFDQNVNQFILLIEDLVFFGVTG